MKKHQVKSSMDEQAKKDAAQKPQKAARCSAITPEDQEAKDSRLWVKYGRY